MAEEKKTTAVEPKKETKPVEAKKEKKPSFFYRAGQWLKSTKAELKKIVWTPRDQVIRNTAVTLVGMVGMSAVLGILDFIFSSAISGLARII